MKEPRTGASTTKVTTGDRLASRVQHHRDSGRRALRELVATPLASLLTLLVMAIALGLPALLQVGLKNLQTLSGHWDDAAQISLFLKPEVELVAAQGLAKRLTAKPGLAALRLIERDAALAEFRQRSGFGEALDQLGANPLPHVLVLTPAAATPEAAERLLAELKALPEVELAQLDVAWVKRLSAILRLGQRALLVLAAALGLGVLLVTGNTIRLAVQNRREEIEVQKLVGATDAFIRRPFLYSGFFQGALAGALAWGLVAGGLVSLSQPVAELAGLYGTQFQLVGLNLLEGLVLIGLAGALGWVGAFHSVGRQLHAIEPS